MQYKSICTSSAYQQRRTTFLFVGRNRVATLYKIRCTLVTWMKAAASHVEGIDCCTVALQGRPDPNSSLLCCWLRLYARHLITLLSTAFSSCNIMNIEQQEMTNTLLNYLQFCQSICIHHLWNSTIPIEFDKISRRFTVKLTIRQMLLKGKCHISII